MTVQAALVHHVALGAAEHEQLPAQRPGERPGVADPARRGEWVGDRAARPVDDRARAFEAAAGGVGDEVAGAGDERRTVLCFGLLIVEAAAVGIPGILGILCIVGGTRRGVVATAVGVEVDDLQRELEPADAVGDRVVQPLQQRGAVTVEALDDDELPQRLAAIEGGFRKRLTRVEQRTHVAAATEFHPAHVGVDVEIRIVDPVGRGHGHARLDHAL